MIMLSSKSRMLNEFRAYGLDSSDYHYMQGCGSGFCGSLSKKTDAGSGSKVTKSGSELQKNPDSFPYFSTFEFRRDRHQDPDLDPD